MLIINTAALENLKVVEVLTASSPISSSKTTSERTTILISSGDLPISLSVVSAAIPQSSNSTSQILMEDRTFILQEKLTNKSHIIYRTQRESTNQVSQNENEENWKRSLSRTKDLSKRVFWRTPSSHGLKRWRRTLILVIELERNARWDTYIKVCPNEWKGQLSNIPITAPIKVVICTSP